MNATSLRDESKSRTVASRLLQNPRLLVLIIGLTSVAGLSSLLILPRMEDPELVERAAVITTFLPGADGERIEALVTEKLEQHLQKVDTIKELRSVSRDGVSLVTIELLDSVLEPESTWSEVRGRIDDVIAELPREASRPAFEILKVRAFSTIVSLVWTSDGPADYSVLRRQAKELQDLLEAVAGTETVERFGDPGEEVLVEVDSRQAAAVGLSAIEIADQLRLTDAKDAAGQLRGDTLDWGVEIANQFRDLSDIQNAILRSSDGISVRVRDLAQISIGPPSPMPRFALHQNKPAIALAALCRSEARIDLWTKQISQVLADFESQLPADIRLAEVLNQNQYVSTRLRELIGNLIMGGLAVIVVVALMMGWRSGLIVASALPLSVLAVLFAMRVFAIPIHQMSITGLIIALGLLIDNAIVVADEIRSELDSGASRLDAVRHTIRKLMIPLIGSSVTTILAFAPIGLMPGPAGEFVGSIAYTVMLSIVASLFFSLTVVSSLAAFLLRVQPDSNSLSHRTLKNSVPDGLGILHRGFRSQRMASLYEKCLLATLRHPIAAIAVSISLPVLGFFGGSRLPEQFFPPAERDQVRIEMELASGVSLSDTERVRKQVDQILRRYDAKQVDWFVAESGPSFYYNILSARKGQPNFAQAIVKLPEAIELRSWIQAVQDDFNRQIPDARVLVRQLEQGPPFDAPIEIRLFGPDLDVLTSIGDKIRKELASLESVFQTRSLLGESSGKLAIDLDLQAARNLGVGPLEVQQQLQAAFDGRVAGSLIYETEQVPVRVRTLDSSRQHTSDVQVFDLVVNTTDNGQAIPLQSLAQFQLQPTAAGIVHFNGRRMNEVAAFIDVGTLPSTVLAKFEKAMAQDEYRLPAGYQMELGGEAAKRNEAVTNLMASVGVLMAMMVATLVLSFGSFRLAAIIGIVGLLSIGLGLGSLYLGGFPFGFMAIIGTMGLVGVAINDSIVVLASLQQEHAHGNLSPEAIVQTVVRSTRHVLATTFTTIAGFTPLIISGGQFWPPLAVAIAGGVAGATLIALVFVPVMYRMVVLPSRRVKPESYAS